MTLPEEVSRALERFGDERAHFAVRPIGDADEGMRRATAENAARLALEAAILSALEAAREEGARRMLRRLCGAVDKTFGSELVAEAMAPEETP